MTSLAILTPKKQLSWYVSSFDTVFSSQSIMAEYSPGHLKGHKWTGHGIKGTCYSRFPFSLFLAFLPSSFTVHPLPLMPVQAWSQDPLGADGLRFCICDVCANSDENPGVQILLCVAKKGNESEPTADGGASQPPWPRETVPVCTYLSPLLVAFLWRTLSNKVIILSVPCYSKLSLKFLSQKFYLIASFR